MPTEIKICGLSDPEGVDAALEAGADYVGFVFFARSPRNVELDRAAMLAARARGKAGIVAVTVDARRVSLSGIVEKLRPDFLQLHGSETPERVVAIRERHGRPVIKVVGVAHASDLVTARRLRGRPLPPRRQAAAGMPRGPAATASPSTGRSWTASRSPSPMVPVRRPDARKCRRGGRGDCARRRRCLLRSGKRARPQGSGADPCLRRRRARAAGRPLKRAGRLTDRG